MASYSQADKERFNAIFYKNLNRPAAWDNLGGGHYWLETHQPKTDEDWSNLDKAIAGSQEAEMVKGTNLVRPGGVKPNTSLAANAAAGNNWSNLFNTGGLFGSDADFTNTIWEGRGYGEDGNQGTGNAAAVLTNIADEVGFKVPTPDGKYFQQDLNAQLFENSGTPIDNNTVAQLIGDNADKLTSGTKKDHYFEQQKQATIDQINKDRAAAMEAHDAARAAGYNTAAEHQAALAAGAGAAPSDAGTTTPAPSENAFHTPAFDMSPLTTVGPEPVPQQTNTSNQFLTQQGLNDWWEGLDKSGFGGTQQSSSGGMDDFMKFMMLMSVMGGGRGGGGYGGSQYGYGGLHPGGVMQSYDPMAQLQGMGTWFKDNFGSGGTTTGNLNTPQ